MALFGQLPDCVVVRWTTDSIWKPHLQCHHCPLNGHLGDASPEGVGIGIYIGNQKLQLLRSMMVLENMFPYTYSDNKERLKN